MLRRLYDWTLQVAGHRHATRWLALVAFAESSVFPIPVDVMMVPMVLAERARAWRIALIATLASVLGGIAGYAIGVTLYESVGRFLLDLYGHGAAFAEFGDLYNQWGAWIVFAAGVSPIPYKVITIASGVTGLALPVFIAASVLARGLRFFAVAGLLWYFGPAIRRLLDRYLGPATLLFLILLIGGFASVRWLAP